MFRTLSLRFGIMFVMIYFAIFFDPMKCEFVWDMQSGICNEFDFEAGQCLSIENPKIFSEILKDAKETVFQNNSELYFVYLTDSKRYARMLPINFMHRNQILSIVKKLKIPIIDVHDDFKNHQNPLSLFQFGENYEKGSKDLQALGHYNQKGYAIVSGKILSRLVDFQCY